jgi:hypothetical protein
MVRDADAIIEMTATLTFSSSVLFPFSNRIDYYCSEDCYYRRRDHFLSLPQLTFEIIKTSRRI